MPLFKSWTSGEGVFAIWKVEESNGQLRALLKGARYLESGRIERAIEGFIERGIPL